MYGLLLTENIYAVAATRTIQLLRAAHAVGFLITIATCIFLIGTLFGFKLPFWVNGIVTAISLFPLFLQGLWSAVLDQRISGNIWRQSLILSVVGGEISMAISLLPTIPLVAAILVSGYLYVTLGLLQQKLEERLFIKTVNEYLIVAAMVLAAALYVTFK